MASPLKSVTRLVTRSRDSPSSQPPRLGKSSPIRVREDISHENYIVQSGPLKITIVADSAYDAALEAVRWWDDSQSPADREAEPSGQSRCGHRSSCRASRPARAVFPTFNLLARAAGESPARAWERVLREKVGQVN